jgi:hypothetical protein
MRINKSLITYQPTSGAGSGTVTSVALSAPTGFTVSGSPVTSSGTLALAFTTGYGIPPLMTGNSGRFLTTNGTTMSWVNIAGTDVTGAALTEVDDTNVTMTLGGTPSTSLLRSVSMTLGWTGTLSAGRGGTGTSGVSGIMLGNSTAPVTGITGIGGQLLRANPSTGVYEFFTPTYMSNPMTTLGDIIYGNAAGAPTRLAANSTANNMYLRSVSSGIPVWGSIAGADITGAAITKTDDTNVTLTLGGTPANSVLRSVSFTLGWTGALSPSRGGTGSTSITGVVIGNGISTMVGVAGTADQLLRRNSANTAYEFFTPNYLSNPMTSLGDIIYGNAAGAPLRLGANATSTNRYLRSVNGNPPTWEQIAAADVSGLITGSGVANFVPQWTGSLTLTTSPLSFSGTEANFGSNTLIAGNTSAPNGSIMLQDNYSTGHLGNIGTMYSGGNLMLGYCVTPSTSSATGFFSATSLTDIPRSSIVLGENVSIYTGAAQTVAVGSAVTMSERLRLFNSGQLRLFNYTSTSSFSGLTIGYLGFTSTGVITTNAIPGGVSGTQNFLAKFDSTGLAVGDSRIVDNGTNFLLNGASSYITGFNLIGDIGIQSASGQASAIIQRSNQTPTSGTTIAFLDAYAITTGSTYQMGGGIEFRASQNWNSSSAGTNIFVQTAPDNTVAPADMFVFLNNGAIRLIGRTSNPLSPAAGTMYYNSSANNMRYYNGTTWITF